MHNKIWDRNWWWRLRNKEFFWVFFFNRVWRKEDINLRRGIQFIRKVLPQYYSPAAMVLWLTNISIWRHKGNIRGYRYTYELLQRKIFSSGNLFLARERFHARFVKILIFVFTICALKLHVIYLLLFCFRVKFLNNK